MTTSKTKLLDLIKDKKYDIDDIKYITEPIQKYLNNKSFMKHLMKMIEIILKDRNGDKKITLEDIKLLSRNILAIGSIVKAIILILISLPKIDLEFQTEATEELILYPFQNSFGILN